VNLLTIANRNRRPDSCDYPLSCENSYIRQPEHSHCISLSTIHDGFAACFQNAET